MLKSYTRGDGVVDWQYCKTDIPEANFPVSGTHVGLAFNPSVYTIIANGLAETHCAQSKRRARGVNLRSALVKEK